MLFKEMDNGIGKSDMPMGANQNNCPQISQVLSLPLLPKNCVALVGNTSVVLGQQVVILDSDSKKCTGEVTATVQSDAARSHNREANSQNITGITPSLHTSVISNVTPQGQIGQPSKASPFGSIQMDKALTSNTLTRTINVKPVCVKPSGTEINLSNQTTSQTQFRVPGNFSVRHMVAKRSRNNQSEIKVVRSKPQFAVQYSPLRPEKIYKPQGIREMSSFKTAHLPKPLLREETLSDIPKEVPSGSITVNLHGQAVKIVGLPAKYSQALASQIHKKETETVQENPKTTQLQSLYDKKMNTLKLTNSVFQKSSIPAPNSFQVSHNQTSSFSQILPASYGQSQSFMIGNVASLSPHSQSQILNNAQQGRTSTCVVTNRGLFTVPRTHHPPESTIIDLSTYTPTPAPLVIKPTPQPYPTLQTILKTSVSPKTFNSSSQIYSHPGVSVNSIPAHQYYPQGATKIGPEISSKKHKISSSKMQYYTSVETFNEGQPVMVVKPVLDSDDDSPVVPGLRDVAIEDSHVNSSFLSASVDHQVHLSSNIDLQVASKSNIDNDDEKRNSTSDLKIQSVFSLANISSTLPDLSNTEDLTNNAEIELDYANDVIDVDDEEETTFNINDPVCKKVCPPSYVVLERLYPQDIEDKKMGRTKISVQCSHHCRVRTLSYLCNLNLMVCENRPEPRDNPINKESEPLPYTAIDVEEYGENDLSISTDRKQKEESPLFSSIKEVDGGTDESSKKAEGQALSSTKDEQNDLSISTDRKQKEESPLFSPIMEVDGGTEKSSKKAEGQAQSSTKDEQNDLSISTDRKQKEESPLFSSIKEVDGGTDESNKKEEGQAQSSTSDEQNEGSQRNKNLKINQREKRNIRPPNKFSPESQKNESPVQENGQPNTGTLSDPEISSYVNEKDELISLKRQVDMKRLEMKKRKKVHKCNLKSKVVKRKSTSSAGWKAPSKRSSGKLPVILGSRLKPGIAVTNQSNPIAIKNTHPVSVNQASSFQTPSLIRPTYVMNCPASSLFGSSSNKGSQQSTSRSPITTLPLLPKNSTARTQPKVTVPLAKVHATLKSLATQLEKTGQKPKGTQFVMFKAINGSVLLKVEPEALLPGNLEALRKAAYSSALSRQTTNITSHQNISKPSEPVGFISTTTNSATNSVQNSVNNYPIPLTANPFAESVSSAGASKRNFTTLSTPQCIQTSSPVPSSLCVPGNVQNTQSIQSNSSVFSSSTISDRQASLLTSSQSGNPPQSSQTLRSLLRMTSNLNTYNDANSALTRVPPNSILLPERQKKRPSDSLSEEEKVVKRQKLEAKYPLPPGVIIKSEPDTSAYDIDNNWSVTTEIDTGYINPSEAVDNTTATEASERVISASSARRKQTNICSYEESQHSGNFDIYDPDSTDTAEEDDDIYDLPPILDDEHTCVEKISESSQDENKDDTPPVLQPMPTLGFRSLLEEKMESSHESTSIEKKQGKSTLASEEPSTKVYDSGYDSVSTSSSVESLVPGQAQDKPPVHTAKFKIQQLKELLRQKELQVENMRKKRLEMPEVDLNAL